MSTIRHEKSSGSKWKYILGAIAVFYGITYVMWSGKSGYYGEDHASETVVHKAPAQETKLRKTLKGGYFACVSEALFDEISMAGANQDTLQIGTLLEKGCVLTKAGVRFSYIEGAGLGVAKIRAYTDDGSVILYTNHENVWY